MEEAVEEPVVALNAPGSPTANRFRLEVTVQGFMSVDSSGRKAYTKGFTRNLIVDSDSMSLDCLVTSLVSEMNWGPNQKVMFWVFDKRIGEDVELKTDSEVADMLEMYKEEKYISLIALVFDKEACSPVEVNEPATAVSIFVIPGDNTAALPPIIEEEQTSSGQEAAKANLEADEDELQIPDVFDSEEEYVGVHDEYMYGAEPNTEPEHGQSESGAQPEEFVGVGNFAGSGAVPAEAEVNDADHQEYVVLHNPEHPDIRKGALFPDIITFRKATRHYATEGFEFSGLKTDKTRLFAYCSHDGCLWCIHASRLQVDKTIQVYKRRQCWTSDLLLFDVM